MAAATSPAPNSPVAVLDPLCGRGTTLNQALMDGYDAIGMDIDGSDFDAYIAFLRSYLKRKRLKHQLDVNPVRRAKKVIGRRAEGSIGASKEQYKAKEAQRLTVVNGDSIKARDFFKSDSVDVVVTDLPYGVQHGSRSRASSLERNPTDLLAAALPGWVELVRPGGAIGLAWNTYVGDRGELERLCAKAGLEVCSGPAYAGFAHRVDQAINRDVLVARKPRP
jgi:tRNA G10  N-methylase Trm11